MNIRWANNRIVAGTLVDPGPPLLEWRWVDDLTYGMEVASVGSVHAHAFFADRDDVPLRRLGFYWLADLVFMRVFTTSGFTSGWGTSIRYGSWTEVQIYHQNAYI